MNQPLSSLLNQTNQHHQVKITWAITRLKEFEHCACGWLLDEGICNRCQVDWWEDLPKEETAPSSFIETVVLNGLRLMVLPPAIIEHESMPIFGN